MVDLPVMISGFGIAVERERANARRSFAFRGSPGMGRPAAASCFAATGWEWEEGGAVYVGPKRVELR